LNTATLEKETLAGFTPTDINNLSDVAGQYLGVPTVWTVANTRKTLAMPAGFTYGVAMAINARGDVAGWVQ
jgi:hypothetical protein